MGVYITVSKKCAHCGWAGTTQIGRVVEALDVDLDDLDLLAHRFTEAELRKLRDAVRDEYFLCQNRECGRSFLLEDTRRQRLAVARELFGPPEED